MTPADTPVSTVSVNRRRSSSWRLASISSRCWLWIWYGHPIEGAAERDQLVVLFAFGNPGGQIAGADPLGRPDEPADRIGELGGEVDADRDGRGEDQHRDHDVDHRELDLQSGALAFELLILRRREVGLVAMGEHPRFDKPPDIEVEIAELVEPDERAHPLFLVVGHDDDFALLGAAQRVLADVLEAERKHETGARQHRPVAIEDRGLGQPAHRRLGGQHWREVLRIELKRGGRAVEVGGHRQRVGADRLLVLLDVGVGHRDRFGDRGAHLIAEPVFDAGAEEQV